MPRIYSASQKEYVSRLAGIEYELREEIRKDELCQKDYQSDSLENLLGAMSVPLPQHFLNSCEAAAINQYLFSMLPSPACLLVCTRFLLSDIEKRVSQLSEEQKKVRLFGMTGPTVEEYARHRLDSARATLTRIRAEYESIEPAEIVRQLNRALQKLASISEPDDPSPLSKMPFRNWVGSFFAMLVPHVAASFVPGKPNIFGRLSGSGFGEFRKIINHCLVPALKMGEHLNAMSAQELWKRLDKKDGAVAVVRNNPFFDHCVFVQADSESDGQKYLRVSDPKYGASKRCSLGSFAKRLA